MGMIMSAKNLHRREFLKTCVTAAAAAAGSGPFQKLFSGQPPRDYEAKGLPTAVLEKRASECRGSASGWAAVFAP